MGSLLHGLVQQPATGLAHALGPMRLRHAEAAALTLEADAINAAAISLSSDIAAASGMILSLGSTGEGSTGSTHTDGQIAPGPTTGANLPANAVPDPGPTAGALPNVPTAPPETVFVMAAGPEPPAPVPVPDTGTPTEAWLMAFTTSMAQGTCWLAGMEPGTCRTLGRAIVSLIERRRLLKKLHDELLARCDAVQQGIAQEVAAAGAAAAAHNQLLGGWLAG